MTDILSILGAISSVISAIVTAYIAYGATHAFTEFKKQKKHEFQLEIAKQLWSYRFLITERGMMSGQSNVVLNAALGAIQLSFTDNKEVQKALKETVKDPSVDNMCDLLNCVAKAVGLPRNDDCVATCIVPIVNSPNTQHHV